MRDIAAKALGSKFFYQDCNAMASELEHLVTTSGQLLSEPDTYQVPKAVATYAAVGNFYIDSGTADHYILSAVSTRQTPIIYLDGMSIRFRTSNENTGISDINVAGLGTVAIKKEDGTSGLGAGDIPAGQVIELVYNGSTGFFELYSHKYEDQVFKTGFNLWTDSAGPLSGYIWINDSTKTTIGNAASGSTIRANADCQALFTLYWAFNILDCPTFTSAGAPIARGGSAAADWAASRRLAIPAAFRKAFAAHDISDPTLMRIGQVEGEKTHTLIPNELAKHAHQYRTFNNFDDKGATANPKTCMNDQYPDTYQNVSLETAHNNMQPTVYKNLYIKL